MLNINDITFTISEKIPNSGGICLAFGIDGEIVYIMNTYIYFYDLLMAGYTIVDAEDDTEFILHFKDQDTIIESLICSELVHALLRSDPDIIEVVRQPLPPKESLGDIYYIEKGWRYDENKNILPPYNWKKPQRKELTEQQKEKLRELGHIV